MYSSVILIQKSIWIAIVGLGQFQIQVFLIPDLHNVISQNFNSGYWINYKAKIFKVDFHTFSHLNHRLANVHSAGILFTNLSKHGPSLTFITKYAYIWTSSISIFHWKHFTWLFSQHKGNLICYFKLIILCFLNSAWMFRALLSWNLITSTRYLIFKTGRS